MAVKEIEADYDFKAAAKLIRPLINPVAADPGSPVEGEIWTNTTDGKLKYRVGGTTYLLATMADVTAGGVSSSLWDANSIVKADTDNTPVAMTVGASTVVGRRASGSIVAISYANLKTDLAITATDVGLGNVPNVDARARSSHTGTQTASTISDFSTAADARISAWVGAAPAALDTLTEIAARIESESTEGDALAAAIAARTRKFSNTYGDGSATTFTVNHALGTTDVLTQVRKVSDNKVLDCVIVNTDANNVAVTFNTAPAASSVRVVVIG